MSMSAQDERTFEGPEPPMQGQTYIDNEKTFWRVQRLTVAENPKGFYLVHLVCGPSVASLEGSMVLGPREFAALVRERDLKTQLQAV